MNDNAVLKPFSLLFGFFLLVEGIWGFYSPVVFGVLTTNTLHASIHVVLGLIALLTGFAGGNRTFVGFLGGLLLVVGILRFVPVASDFIAQLLAVNEAVALVNIAVGAIAMVLVWWTRPRRLLY